MQKFEELYYKALNLYQKQKIAQSITWLERGMRAFPENQQLWKLYELYGLNCWQQGKAAAAARAMDKAVQKSGQESLAVRQRIFSNYLFLLHYVPDISNEDMRRAHFLYGNLCQAITWYQHHRTQKRKVRIGYISPDFNAHVDVFFIVQLLACYNRNRFEVVCYAVSTLEDETTEQLKKMVNGWRNLSGLSEQQAAEQIYQDQVDILFDLSGHCAGGITLRIAAYKPAPIQMTGIGWFDTTGLPAIDYFLSDKYCDSPQNDAFFIERLLRLPHTHLCYTPPERALTCRQERKKHTGIVFGSFNNFNKITDKMLSVWLQILDRVPGSRLLLKNTRDNLVLEKQIAERAAMLGYTKEQLEIRSSSCDYQQEYMDLDIAVDTFPYTGGGTTCDALFMGVPVITLTGDRHGSRFGYSLLMNAGLGELAAMDLDGYITRAVALAQDGELLAGLQKNLRHIMKRSPLMNGSLYTHEVENFYEEIWQKYCQEGGRQ